MPTTIYEYRISSTGATELRKTTTTRSTTRTRPTNADESVHHSRSGQPLVGGYDSNYGNGSYSPIGIAQTEPINVTYRVPPWSEDRSGRTKRSGHSTTGDSHSESDFTRDSWRGDPRGPPPRAGTWPAASPGDSRAKTNMRNYQAGADGVVQTEIRSPKHASRPGPPYRPRQAAPTAEGEFRTNTGSTAHQSRREASHNPQPAHSTAYPEFRAEMRSPKGQSRPEPSHSESQKSSSPLRMELEGIARKAVTAIFTAAKPKLVEEVDPLWFLATMQWTRAVELTITGWVAELEKLVASFEKIHYRAFREFQDAPSYAEVPEYLAEQRKQACDCPPELLRIMQESLPSVRVEPSYEDKLAVGRILDQEMGKILKLEVFDPVFSLVYPRKR